MEPAVANLPEPLFERAVELLRELTAISSDSGDPAGLRRAAERLASALRERGLAVEIRDESPADGASPLPVLYARGADTSRGHLLLIGHLDTVLPAIAPRLDGDRLIATGAIDMKGGSRPSSAPWTSSITAAAAARRPAAGGGAGRGSRGRAVAGRRPPLGGDRPRALGAGAGRARRCRRADAETIVAGRRGMFDWRLEADGQAAHSGLHYWEGRSALAAAARWVRRGGAPLRHGGGPTVNAGRFVAGDSTFVDGLAAAHDLLGTDRQLNVVPDRAIVEGEARFLRAARATSIAVPAAVRPGRRRRDRHRSPSRFGPYIPPVDPDGPQARPGPPRRGSRRRARLAPGVESERGGISFPNFLPDPGRIPVLDGLGPVGGGMHTREEFVELRSLRRRIVLLADLMAEDVSAV